ncbi:MAG: type II toxin-antitoxin system PemK/MazF family toxin [Proteobacteria bacterium]|nr:type II toxin-antitoxin system PemK/MazF family toxin [Pseudomonadota bacterium]
MPNAKPGEVWQVDLGMAAKSRPCLVLTPPPGANELAVFTVVAHPTAIRGNRWKMAMRKHFLSPEGAFDVQRMATVESVRLERKLGELTAAELDSVLDRLAERLGI